MKILSTTKGKVMAGALALAVVGGGAAGASSFGFVDQLAGFFGVATEKAANYSASAVSNGDTYETAIKKDINDATSQAVGALAQHAGKEITRGNNEVKAQYDALSSDLKTVATNGVKQGKEQITTKVDSKVAQSQLEIEQAAANEINKNLAAFAGWVNNGQVTVPTEATDLSVE